MIGMLLAILTFEIVIIVLLENVLYKKIITPFTILSVPYLVIIYFTVILGPDMGFKEVYPQSILVWIIGLPIFWIPGAIMKWFFLKNRLLINDRDVNIENTVFFVNSRNWLLILSWIALFLSSLGWIIAINSYGFENIGSEEFASFYMSGVSGHALVFNIIPFIFFLGVVRRKNWFISITILLIFVSFFLGQVKTWVMIPLISGLLFRQSIGNLRLSFKNIIYIIIGCVLIFFTIYFISIGPNIVFLKKLFLEYLYAGTLGLSEYLKSEFEVVYDPFFLINPVRNIFNFIVGNEMEGVLQPIYLNICDGDYISKSNVRTFFGTIWINSSMVIGISFTLAVSAICYFFYNLFLVSKNFWIAIFTCYLLGGLFMGWFDIYFNHLNYYEIPFYIMVLMIISRVKLPVVSKIM